MYPILLHLYGPFAINSYGVAILIGVLLFIWRVNAHPLRRMLMSAETLKSLVATAVVVAFVGGRLLDIVSNRDTYTIWQDYMSFWNGGFSVLGGFGTVIVWALWQLSRKGIPILPTFDLGALYAPLLLVMGRVGCLLAGCCCGAPTAVAWAITYTNAECRAPLGIPLHPTQIYSIVLQAVIFIVLHGMSKKLLKQPGTIAMVYLILAGLERFVIDFFRFDRVVIASTGILSIHQCLALGLVMLSSFVLVFLRYKHNWQQSI
jgi:phosphatidylglycerol---prolipoprotein diacylglyceryl transferase